VVYWQLTALGAKCEVVAPTLVPVKSGERVKTDRRDALKLARNYRAGELTAVWVPDAAHEALRDLVRAREAAKKDQLRAKHRLSKFLLRHGRRPASGGTKGKAHGRNAKASNRTCEIRLSGIIGHLGKRSLGGIVNPPCNRTGKNGNPPPFRPARPLYPNPEETGSTSYDESNIAERILFDQKRGSPEYGRKISSPQSESGKVLVNDENKHRCSAQSTTSCLEWQNDQR
jgi:hypothetical protein